MYSTMTRTKVAWYTSTLHSLRNLPLFLVQLYLLYYDCKHMYVWVLFMCSSQQDYIILMLHHLEFVGLYETPGGTILLAAHVDIELFTLDKVSSMNDQSYRKKNVLNWFAWIFVCCYMDLLYTSGSTEDKTKFGYHLFRTSLQRYWSWIWKVVKSNFI